MEICELTLGADSRLPLTEGIAEPARPFLPPFVAPHDEAQAAAMALWINAHQLFFITLCAGASCADQALHALREGRAADAAPWLGRITDLRWGAVALTAAAGSIAPEIYSAYIRPAMASMRADFSGVSSRDNWRFDDALRTLEGVLSGAPHDSGLRESWRGYEAATRTWWEVHGRVMRRLVGDPTSLARKAYDKLVADTGTTQNYREFQAVLRSDAALTTNDEFFAVRRGVPERAPFRAAIARLAAWITPRLPAGEQGHARIARALAVVDDALAAPPAIPRAT